MSTATRASVCPSCKGAKTERMYLCSGCWFALTGPARRALTKHDGMPAVRRVGELRQQLRDDVPLHEIVISR